MAKKTKPENKSVMIDGVVLTEIMLHDLIDSYKDVMSDPVSISDTQLKALAGVGYANGIEVIPAPGDGGQKSVENGIVKFSFTSDFDEVEYALGFSDANIVSLVTIENISDDFMVVFGIGTTALKFFPISGVPGSGQGTFNIYCSTTETPQ